jgi:hypothetical protein
MVWLKLVTWRAKGQCWGSNCVLLCGVVSMYVLLTTYYVVSRLATPPSANDIVVASALRQLTQS